MNAISQLSTSEFCAYLREESRPVYRPSHIEQAILLCEHAGVDRVYMLSGGDYFGDDLPVTFAQLTPKSVQGVRATIDKRGNVDYRYCRVADRKRLAIRVEEVCRALGTE